MRVFVLTLLFAMVTCFSATSSMADVALWGRFEVSFRAASDTAWDATRLTVAFTSPSGKKHSIEGFWNGGQQWLVRFMPNETGKWSYTTTARPEVAGLHEIQGSFECRSGDSPNRFLKHGELLVSPSGTYLAHADGTPFFWLGDTVWTGPAFATLDDWHIYLKDRAAKNFSVVQFNMVCPWRTAATDREGNRAFEGEK